MSFVVFAIGAAHALPPIVGAIVSRNKRGVIAGAIVGGFVALLSGSPIYIIVDLIGLAAGIWFSFSVIE